jgi:hypothetical protein
LYFWGNISQGGHSLGENTAYLRYVLDGNNLGCEDSVPVKLTFRLAGSKDLTGIWCAAVRIFHHPGVSLWIHAS